MKIIYSTRSKRSSLDNADIMVNKKDKEDNELKVKKMLTDLEPMEMVL